MKKQFLHTAIQLTDRSYFLSDLHYAYIFHEGRFYDFWKERYGKKFLQHAWESQSKLFSGYELKKFKGISKIDSTFEGDSIKHKAFNFLIAECFPIRGKRYHNIDNINFRQAESLNDFAAFLFFLAVSYRNIDTFAKEIHKRNGATAEEIYYHLDQTRMNVFIKSTMAVDAFMARMKLIQNASRGGKAPKSSKLIFHSVAAMVKANPSYSAEMLWRNYRKNHAGLENADDCGVYFEVDHAMPGNDFLVDEDGKRIGFHTFRGNNYFGKAKKRILSGMKLVDE